MLNFIYASFQPRYAPGAYKYFCYFRYDSCMVKNYDWDNYTENDRAWLESSDNLTSIRCPYAEYAFDSSVYKVTATSEVR